MASAEVDYFRGLLQNIALFNGIFSGLYIPCQVDVMKKPMIIGLAMGGQLFAGTTAMTSDALDGETLAQELCIQCHGFGRVERAMAEKDQAAREAAVDRMIGKRDGLLNAEGRVAVLEYLVNK